MWITLFLVTLVWFPTTQAVVLYPYIVLSLTLSLCLSVSLTDCVRVFSECQNRVSWTRCYEETIGSCRAQTRSPMHNFFYRRVSTSEEVEASPTHEHSVHIPASALQRSRGSVSEGEVQLVATVINSSYFKLSPPRRSGRRRLIIPDQSVHMPGTILGELVLAVKAGSHNVAITNLSQPIKLIFKHDNQVGNGACVFWQESKLNDGTGNWSTDGCGTTNTGTEFICSCNHLSFFAVLVNPVLSVDKSDAVNLSYITYIGSALSVFFTVISLIIYICLQRRRPEKAIGVHLQLTAALLCLHLSFLLCSFWVWQLNEDEEDWVCRGLGLFLHWSLLATFSWTALEGFHLYLLLVRVFNIYVRRYLLKLSLVGWGIPTFIVLICGNTGVYGKYSLDLRDADNYNSTAQICWMRSQFPQRLFISYATTVVIPSLVILCNSCMLGLVVFKLWGLRVGTVGIESSGGWKKMDKEKWMKLWKDCATVLGLSCVLGIPWALMSTTYFSLSGIYIFTILNSFQGVCMFLWSVALSCKSRSDNNSSRDPSSQKVMTTSFNN
ncbi:adhesion G-protein coupled receptor G1-like [Sebastes umbrosus]|uniref:adhesion G-protein coupled receptor G1-like n=1 Tax=Sebastes umbrosus TaxID=72105 RepID=UPI00189E0E27|nr:adhesion G-protein coupled receptor G1-like [Sebastes umbrosus]